MRIARRAGHRRMPWKNGQGLTEEIAAFPAGSDVDSFDWRLSIAHVGADGPFSVFAGVDRTIAVLDGSGMVLDLPEGKRADLAAGGAPFSFSGDWSVSSRNLDGPTVDLNIMTRRGRCAHAMRRLTLAPGESFVAPHSGWVVFNAPATIAADGRDLSIDRFDALALERSEGFQLRSPEQVEVLHIAIGPG